MKGVNRNLFFVICLITFLLPDICYAGGDKNFCKISAKAEPIGAGFVYARGDNEHGPFLFKDNISSRHYGNSATTNKKTIYLSVAPSEGFAISHWTDPNGNIFTSGTEYTLSSTCTDPDKTIPTDHLFTAHFVDTYVSAYSANTSLCPVTVSPPINRNGDNVILTAEPANSISFIGWRKKGTSTIINTQNPLTITATETKTTYEAVFKNYSGSQKEFIKIQSKSNPNKYLSVMQDEFSYTPVFFAIGGYSNFGNDVNHQKGINAALTFLKGGTYSTKGKNDYIEAQGDLNLANDNYFNPGNIMYIPQDKTNIFVQGTSLQYITEGYTCHHGGKSQSATCANTAHRKVDGQKVELTQIGNSYSFSISPSMYDYSIGTMFIVDNNGSLDIVTTEGTDDSYCWNLVPIDNNNTYFSFNPTQTSNDKYYTTLRTGFSYKVKNPDKVKVYEINEINSENLSVVKMAFGADEVIPAGLGVVIESTSQNPEDNILIPWDIDYVKENSVLYGKYGKRLHCYTGVTAKLDQYDDCTEDGIGYFKVPYTGSSDIYKLGVKHGHVGFWDKVQPNEIVSGNEAYSYYPCALFGKVVYDPDEAVEADELTEQASSTFMVTDNSLTVVHSEIDAPTTIYCKDGNGSALSREMPAEGQIDYMHAYLKYAKAEDYDQSNWFALEYPSVYNGANPSRTLTNVWGHFLEKTDNNIIRLLEAPETGGINSDYLVSPFNRICDKTDNINTYIPASFIGTQTGEHNGQTRTFFLMKPKAMEIADITGAVWDANSQAFVMPAKNTRLEDGSVANAAGLKGGFRVDLSMSPAVTLTDLDNNDGQAFEFRALIKYTPSASPAPRRADPIAGDASLIATDWTVYPINFVIDDNHIVTSVRDIRPETKAVSVEYVNAAGLRSTRPWKGVNIVVTRYDNGTTQTSKRVF